MLCLPYAGGGATLFHAWPDELPDDVEVCAVQLPARQDRLNDPPVTRVESIVHTVAELLADRPTAPLVLFGHSCGALVAFELARYLEGQGRGVAVLIVSAQRPPQLGRSRDDIYDLPDSDFFAALHHHYGTPLEYFDNPDLVALTLPSLRADLEVMDTYRYWEAPPLRADLHVLAGLRDTLTPPSDVAGWKAHTQQRYAEHWVDTGHFFVDTHRPWVIGRVAEILGGL